ELRRADRERIHRAEPHGERIAALPIAQARRREIRPRAAERPEDVDLEGVGQRDLRRRKVICAPEAASALQQLFGEQLERFGLRAADLERVDPALRAGLLPRLQAVADPLL